MNKRTKRFFSVLALFAVVGSIAGCKSKTIVSSSSQEQTSSYSSASSQASSSKGSSSTASSSKTSSSSSSSQASSSTASSSQASSEDSSVTSSQASSSQASSSNSSQASSSQASSSQTSSSSNSSSEASSETSSETSSEVSSESSSASSEVSTAPITYTITWANSDGTTLDTDTVEEGVTPKYTGETPTKTADKQYTYTFDGWDPTVVAAVSDATYTAHYSAAVNSYKITWKNYDGTVLEEDTTAYGTTPTYDGTTPVKASTDQYTYTFKGWDPEVISVKADATYTAVFSETINPYEITWNDEDGTLLRTDTVNYGEIPSYTGTTPTKAADDKYTYEFAGWDPEPTEVTENATYTAKYTSAPITYTVIWKNDEGTTLETDTVNAGDTPKYDGETPTKTSENLYTYTFKGWDSDITAAFEDKTYTAVFTQATRLYKISWLNYDGSEISTENYEYGTTPSYKGSTPNRSATSDSIYTFTGWSSTIASVTGDASYTAQYEATALTYTSDNLGYSYSSTTNSYTVISYSGTDTCIEIPETYNDGTNGIADVTVINKGVFDDDDEDVIAIKIPKTVSDIAKYSFLGSSNLMVLSVDSENATYATKDNVLFTKDMTEMIKMPQGFIGEYTLPDTVTTIDELAIYSCPNLTKITIGKGLKTIVINMLTEYMTLCECPALASYEVDPENTCFSAEDGILYNYDKTTLIKAPQTITGDVSIASTVTTISQLAFAFCSNMTSFKPTAPITYIGEGAFYCCGDGIDFILPNTIEYIGTDAFIETDLSKSGITEDNVTYLPFPDKSAYYLIDGTEASGAVTVKAKTVLIAGGAFSGSEIESITMDDDVLSLGNYCFAKCEYLTSVTLSNSITSIFASTFESCDMLASLVIPSSVTYIGDEAFLYTNEINLYFKAENATGITYQTDYDASMEGVKATYFYDKDTNTDGTHWHYVDGVPTVWAD